MRRWSLVACDALVAMISLAAIAGCGDSATSTRSNHRVTVSLGYTPSAARGLFQGPFVSVADSVAVVVTASDKKLRTFGAHLPRRDTTVTFQVELPDGAAQFDGRVVNGSGQTLFAGTQPATIAADGFVVRLRVTAQTPVLLLAPDTVHIPIGAGTARQGIVSVYNRGVGTLVARFRGPSAQLQSPCAPLFCFVPNTQFPVDSVVVPALGTASVLIRVQTTQVTFPVTMTVVSPQGSVSLVLVSP